MRFTCDVNAERAVDEEEAGLAAPKTKTKETYLDISTVLSYIVHFHSCLHSNHSSRIIKV